MINNKRPFIIDCDTGTDDAIAIAVALYCDEIEVKACTTVNGNVALEHTSKNTLNLIDYLGFDVPVSKGAWRPLNGIETKHDGCHGPTGLGTLVLPEAGTSFINETASALIHNIAVKEAGALELLIVGPMTNIAIALLNYPDLNKLIRHIYFMGGAVKGGNVTTSAEFNIWVDPEAAQVVIDSGIPMTMVGLDVTEEAYINREEAERIAAIGSKTSGLVYELLEFMFKRAEIGGEYTLMHDALALAAALIPDCMEFDKYYVAVECAGKWTRGHTMTDINRLGGYESNMNVALKLNRRRFVDWLIETLGNSALDT